MSLTFVRLTIAVCSRPTCIQLLYTVHSLGHDEADYPWLMRYSVKATTCRLWEARTEAVFPRRARMTVRGWGSSNLWKEGANRTGFGRPATLRTEVSYGTNISIRLGDRRRLSGPQGTEMSCGKQCYEIFPYELSIVYCKWTMWLRRYFDTISNGRLRTRPGLQGPECSVRALLLQKEPGGQEEQSFWDVLPTIWLKWPLGHGDGTEEPSAQ